ncbi:MAG: VWA domain-containing protein [Novosphingobium sp.]|nr:VWA domain-containing protein [Novosphingobium sp.]
MDRQDLKPFPEKNGASAGLLGRLARDRVGNTAIMVAASIAPLMAMIGGGIDMSRGYLTQVRMQQACDSGVLAARKRLGTAIVTDGIVPSEVADTGNRFFDLNFKEGDYGSENVNFTMSLEEDFAISGEATVEVPTTIMAIFGKDEMDVTVKCEARINYSDLDIMFVLDTTGSMNQTNPGDSVNRITALRDTVQDFYTKIEASKTAGTRVRYGFVPYATNVNVGGLLEDDWVVDEWTYQSREGVPPDDTTPFGGEWWGNWTYKSGTAVDTINSTYAATYHPPSGGGGGGGGYGEGSTSSSSGGGGSGWYSCNGSQPANTATVTDTLLTTTIVDDPNSNPPSKIRTRHYSRTTNGNVYWTWLSGTTCKVTKSVRTNYVEEYDRISRAWGTWNYGPVTKDVSNWRSETNGCMEERDTYEIYSMSDPVDFTRALDLDIDTVPTAGNPATQWRPMYPAIIWARALTNGNANSWSKAPIQYGGNYFHPADYPALVACPAPAQKLAEMTPGEVSSYMASLTPNGQTYHDIGMIWGGRLLSPDGLFSADNADRTGKTTSRHLIFLTDGITEPLDISYTSYGIEPLDERRWTDRPDPLLDRTIEMRFGIACNEVKKRNITVWVIGFGTTMNDIMKQCAGDGHWFQADDATELADTFEKIAKSLAELRVSK